MKKKAFTLIEILVTVSIIGILMAFIVPGLIKARQQAQKASCLNNLKQIMLAMNIYANDNNDEYPVEKIGAFKKLLTENYVDDEDVFYCPAVPHLNISGIDYSTYLYNETTDLQKGVNRNAASNYPLVCDSSGNHGQLSGHVGYTGGQVQWLTVGGSWPAGIPWPPTDGNNPEPHWVTQELP